jgi:hypothetical protein
MIHLSVRNTPHFVKNYEGAFARVSMEGPPVRDAEHGLDLFLGEKFVEQMGF